MELLGFISLTSFAALPIVLIVPTVMYLLESIALMRIGKKMGLSGGWRAFVPVLNLYFMGKIAEQDDLNRRPDKKRKRWGRIALWLSVVLLLFSALFVAALAVLALFTGYSGSAGDTPSIVAGSFGILLVGILAYLAFFTLVLVLCIVVWVILYKIYRAMADDHAIWMFVLSVFFGLATPILLLVLAFCSKFPLSRGKEAQGTLVIEDSAVSVISENPEMQELPKQEEAENPEMQEQSEQEDAVAETVQP